MGRKKTDNRWSDFGGGMTFVVPLEMLRCPNFTRLTPYGTKLILDLARQYTGLNNGYLCASWSLMKDAGWGSSATLCKAVNECEHYGLIVRTQQGGLNKPNLHAFTWRRIDEKKDKPPLLIAPTVAPLNSWKDEKDKFNWATGNRKTRRRSRRRQSVKSAA